jgi:preprotein translocase subunit SecE
VRPQLVINTVLVVFYLFLLVFFIALAGISLRGEVTHVSRVITIGAVV